MQIEMHLFLVRKLFPFPKHPEYENVLQVFVILSKYQRVTKVFGGLHLPVEGEKVQSVKEQIKPVQTLTHLVALTKRLLSISNVADR
jgi:VanZ family protein